MGMARAKVNIINSRPPSLLIPLLPLLLELFSQSQIVADAAQLVEVTNFGTNPSGIKMFEYVPDKVANNPALLVVNHYCGGDARVMFFTSKYAAFADQQGFVVVYPEVTRSVKCWDVFSAQGLRRNGGSDSQGIVAMVQYEIQKRKVDPNKVFVVGHSSGAMMTNVLMAEYPDVFQAGTVFAGVPFGCFATTGSATWNSTCAGGNVVQSAQQWGNLVRGAFSGYSGHRPRVQLFHGTADTTLNYKNLGEEVKQWTNVLGLSSTPTSTEQRTPDVSSFNKGVTNTRQRYGGSGNQPTLEVNILQGADHGLNSGGVLGEMAARFLGLIP